MKYRTPPHSTVRAVDLCLRLMAEADIDPRPGTRVLDAHNALRTLFDDRLVDLATNLRALGVHPPGADLGVYFEDPVVLQLIAGIDLEAYGRTPMKKVAESCGQRVRNGE